MKNKKKETESESEIVFMPSRKKRDTNPKKYIKKLGQATVDALNFEESTNITPVLEDVLEISKINSAEDLQMLVDALRSMPEDTEVNTESMAQIMEIIKAKKK